LIAGLILAAGEGTRFGDEPKQLAKLNGRPLLEHAIRAQCAVSELARVVVVLGAHAERVLDRVEFDRAEPVICEDWSAGQAASLRTGLDALQGAAKVVVTLGDAPLITPAVIAHFAAEAGGARALYRGRPGHPVVLGSEQLRALSSLTGSLAGDRGARDVLSAGPTIECGELCSGRDVDTPDDLEAIRHEARAVV
jgi:CTP:molybdopterin cytidylyltransferase MocA